MASSKSEEEEEVEVPLVAKRYFGAGLKRKREVKFVPSTSNLESTRSLPTTPSTSVAERYRQVVLDANVSANKAGPDSPSAIANHADPDTTSDKAPAVTEVEIMCDICKRPITSSDTPKTHQSSIVHQICLQHSHPPSHLDRRRNGLAMLRSQGWDPDSRRGLGAEGEGILHPIKAKENPSRAGLGVKLKPAEVVQRPVKLDAGKVRLREMEGKKKAQRLREAFYRSEDVVRYLGE